MKGFIIFIALISLIAAYAYSRVTIGGGFIPHTGVGGLFVVNSSSTTVELDGEISVSNQGDNPAVWVWIDGNRYEFTLTLNNPVQDFLLLETGDFILQEDGTSKVVVE